MADSQKTDWLSRATKTLESISGHFSRANTAHQFLQLHLSEPFPQEKTIDGMLYLGLAFIFARRGWMIIRRIWS